MTNGDMVTSLASLRIPWPSEAHRLLDFPLPVLLTGAVPLLFAAVLLAISRWVRRSQHEFDADLLTAFMDHIPDNVFFKDRTSRFVRVSRSMASYCGMLDPSEVVGKTDADIFSPEHADKARMDEEEVMRTGEAKIGIEEMETWPDGRTSWVLTTKVPLWNRKRQIIGTMGVTHNITDRKRAADEIRHLALHDPLTGLPNRRHLEERLNELIETCKEQKKQVAVLLLDLDRFKDVNDTFGHPLGDRLLGLAALRLRDCLREADFISRFGGDEFVVVLPMFDDRSTVEQVAQRILASFRRPFKLDGHELHMGASIGISIFPDDSDYTDGLVQFADSALYEAKRNGRGMHFYFNQEITAATRSKHTLRGELHQGWERGQFELYFQPFVSTPTGRVVGFESLLRWNHPTRGLLLPGKFLTELEETGLMQEIGQWAIRNAASECKRWNSMGFEDVRVAVNLSAQQFYRGDIVRTVREILDKSGLPNQLLELELTETITLDSSDNTLKTITQLKDLGVSLALDDFGTGWSSLSYLGRFPLDRLKIDGSFVRDLDVRPQAGAIVESILALGRNLGLVCIGEGVESRSQFSFLKNYGCPEIQGFLCSQAVPAESCQELLKKHFNFDDAS